MILLVDNGSKKTPNIESIINKYNKTIKITFHELVGFDFSKVIGVVLSGSPILLSKAENIEILKYFQVLLKIKIPILGICFGHQIISLLYGAEINLITEERTLTKIILKQKSDLFVGFNKEFFMQEDHCEFVSLPSEFQLVASSKNCLNEAMQHINLPIYGVQFHPEVSGEIGEILIKNFITICNRFNS